VLVSGLEVWCSAAFSGRKVVCWFLGPVALSGYVGLANLGSESNSCVASRVHLVVVSISFEKNFYRLPFTPPLWFAVSVLQRYTNNIIVVSSEEMVIYLLKSKKLTNLGCPPSSHVIDREINTKVVYG
jgi:hypothetical protein